MIYLTRTHADAPPDIAVVEGPDHAAETIDHAARYERDGYTRCTPDAFRAAWRERDERALEEREVGGA